MSIIKGVVIGFTPDGVKVDIGRENTGLIPFEELSNAPYANAEDIVNIGDELDLEIVISDDDGTILSKRIVDKKKSWDFIEDAKKNGTVVKGIITDVVKGGVIAVSNGIKVFIPHSLTGLEKYEELVLLNQEVSFYVIETTYQRRRAVGSMINYVRSEVRRMASIRDSIECFREIKEKMTDIPETIDLKEITALAQKAVTEILEKANLKKNSVFVVGCSSSTVAGKSFGTASSMEIAQAIFDGIYPELEKRGIFIAAQCCEHLNRAIVTENAAAVAQNRETVNVVPQPKAGGSFATITYNTLKEPVVVEHIKADAGIDIGGVLIGMHLKDVAVPLTLSVKQIGEAHITSARTRPKFIGGERAYYNDKLK